MSVALIETSFLSNPLTSSFKPQRRTVSVLGKHVFISCRHSPDEGNDSTRKSENQLAKLALVAMAAGVLTLGSVDPAAAAKTGGRVGGQAFKSSAPRASGPRINNSRFSAGFIPIGYKSSRKFQDQCVYQPTSCPSSGWWIWLWFWCAILWWMGLVSLLIFRPRSQRGCRHWRRI